MKKSYNNRNIRLTVRMNKNEHNMLENYASHRKESLSNYMLNLLLNQNKNRDKNHIKSMSKSNLMKLNNNLTQIYDSINQFRLDYSRAFANLEHDNNLFNHNELPTIHKETIVLALKGILANSNELKSIMKSLSRLEANIYDN